MTLHQVIDYINSCSFDELGLIHHLAANRFHHLKHRDEYEQDEQMKRNLTVGDQVSWSSDKTMARGKDRIYGIVIRLNPKTATITTKEHGQWRVAYSFLKKESDFTSKFNESIVMEGEVVHDEHEDIDLSSDTGKIILQSLFAKDSEKQNIGNQSNTNKKRKKSKKRNKKKSR
jgi:hypothetical protein